MVVRPKAPDTVSWPSPAFRPASQPSSRNLLEPLETCAPFSPSLRRPPSSGFSIPRGNGFLRARHLLDPTPCSATSSKHAPIRPTDVCFPILLDYEHPYSLVPGASPRLAPWAERRALGTHRVAGGAERSRRSVFPPLRRAACALVGRFRARGACCSPSDRRDQPLTLLSQLLLRFSLGFASTPSRGPSRAGAAEDRPFAFA